MGTILGGAIIAIAIWFVIFLVCREFSCWYFKINDHLEQQKRQTDILQSLVSEVRALRTGEEPQDTGPSKEVFTEWGEPNGRFSAGLKSCPRCKQNCRLDAEK